MKNRIFYSLFVTGIFSFIGGFSQANDGGTAFINLKGIQPYFTYTVNPSLKEMEQEKIQIAEFRGGLAEVLKKSLPKASSVPNPGDPFYDHINEFASLSMISPSATITFNCEGGEVDEARTKFIPYPEKARCKITFTKNSEGIYSDPIEMCCGGGSEYNSKRDSFILPVNLGVASLNNFTKTQLQTEYNTSEDGFTNIVEFHGGNVAEFMHIIPIFKEDKKERVRILNINLNGIPSHTLRVYCVTEKPQYTNDTEKRYCRLQTNQ